MRIRITPASATATTSPRSRPKGVLRTRLGEIELQTLPYGQRIAHNGVGLSLHPAGHVLGSAQVRLEHGGQVWVASGDYKVAPDKTCAPFEPVKCDVFITESTFGLADLPLVPRTRKSSPTSTAGGAATSWQAAPAC